METEAEEIPLPARGNSSLLKQSKGKVSYFNLIHTKL